MKLNIIGCGRLGKTLGRLFSQRNLQIQNVFNTSEKTSLEAVTFIGNGIPTASLDDIQPADFTLISTPDDKIEAAYVKLVELNKLRENSIVFHCSGSLSSEILRSSKQLFVGHVASVHPVKSFASPLKSVQTFPGTYCAIEGNELAINQLSPMFSGIGGVVFKINKTSKGLYHSAGVTGSNYLVSLSHMTFQSYVQSGVSPEIARNLTNTLMGNTLHNLAELSHQQALTGPLERGDSATIKRHLEALESRPDYQEVYRALGKVTLPLTRHNQMKIKELVDILEGHKP